MRSIDPSILRIAGLMLVLAVSINLSSCKDPEDSPTEDLTFAPALQNYRTVIAGRYTVALASAVELETEAAILQDAPTESELELIREALKEAWIQWQYATLYGFGPAETLETHSKVNTFPTDAENLDELIVSGDWNALEFDERGLPALDYLLNGHDLEDLGSGPNAENLRGLIIYLTELLHEDLEALTNAWESHGATFISQTGASATSSMSQLVNGFIANYEQLKRDKIALPLGLLTLDIPLPERVESYYGGYSKELAAHHLQGTLEAYLGSTLSEDDGIGLDDMLNDADAFHEGSAVPLDTYIQEEIEEAIIALDLVPDPLDETIQNDPDIVQEAYLELQELVVLFKADMPSALGISITFTDNDGD